MVSPLQRVAEKKISRRDFLKVSAAATAGLALGGCGNSLATVGPDYDPKSAQEEKWVVASCWHNCGGRCVNKVLVVDGVVIRQKTDERPDTKENYQLRACVRGRSQRNHVLSPDRLKYPMIRKHWKPHTGGDKSLRGRDEWVRISWDEALDIVADELKYCIKTYGNRAIFSGGYRSSWDGHGTGPDGPQFDADGKVISYGVTGRDNYRYLFYRGGEIGSILALLGGYVTNWGTATAGAWSATPSRIGFGVGWKGARNGCDINDRTDLRNVDYLVMLGVNTAWEGAGSTLWRLTQDLNPNAKCYGIDPFYNDTYAVLGAEWIPIRPSTDMAFLLALAYCMIKLDDPVNNPIIDWDFLRRCTIGFNKEMMPDIEGVDPNDNFYDYVIGKVDGIPKTPEWAERICGVPPAKVWELAQVMRKDNKVAFVFNFSSARTKSNQQLPQMLMTIGCMGGHIGKPGHMTGVVGKDGSFDGGPNLYQFGKSDIPSFGNQVEDTINDPLLWKSIYEGKYMYYTAAAKKPAEEREIDIKLIYHNICATFHSRENSGMAVKVAQSDRVNFIVSHAQWLLPYAQYSDLVLPVTTDWENKASVASNYNRHHIFLYSQVIPPMYECKTDMEIAKLLAQRLGLDAEFLFPGTYAQQAWDRVTRTKYRHPETGEWVNLVSVTQEDIDEWNKGEKVPIKAKPQDGLIPLKKWKTEGVYTVPRRPGDQYTFIAYKEFCEDPENNPVPSESGKMEIFCKKLVDDINRVGMIVPGHVYKGYPTYLPALDGYEYTFKNNTIDSGEKGEYPFQLYQPHYLRSAHYELDNTLWTREAFARPAFINASDAAKKGIKDGDTILIWNDVGKCLRIACCTERIMPGVVALTHGGLLDIDHETGIDMGGNDNNLSRPNVDGLGVSGWNSNVCNYEKWTGKPLPRDCDRPLKIVDYKEKEE